MKYFFALACIILLYGSTFGQVILTQTHSDATIGLDRKAFLGLGNTSAHSDGYAHDFTLPARTNPCQQITGISVAINLTGYTNNNSCPHPTLYYNLFYGCGPYGGGATCLPETNLIAEPNFPPNTSLPPFNFGNPLGGTNIEPDFGGNLSVDIIPVSNPGCNAVGNGHISYQYTITVTVTVEDNPNVIPTFTQVPGICEGETIPTLPTTSQNGITGSWSPAINNTTTTEYTFTPDAGQCASNQTMTITVNPATTPTFTQVPAVCEGETIPVLPTTSQNGITGTWSPALNNTTTTEYTFTPNAGQCASNQTMIIVVNINTAPVISEVKTNGFDIEILTTETGDYSYSIDGRNFQYGNIFYGIRGGRYSITVRDNSGCGQDVVSHLHFVIPKFFTPNNDGFNDFFEIRGIQEFGNSEVNIFDRYGKLLKSYRNSAVVWDGTYLGNLLPTNDYWYQIIVDGEEFTGHFTLKR